MAMKEILKKGKVIKKKLVRKGKELKKEAKAAWDKRFGAGELQPAQSQASRKLKRRKRAVKKVKEPRKRMYINLRTTTIAKLNKLASDRKVSRAELIRMVSRRIVEIKRGNGIIYSPAAIASREMRGFYAEPQSKTDLVWVETEIEESVCGGLIYLAGGKKGASKLVADCLDIFSCGDVDLSEHCRELLPGERDDFFALKGCFSF